MPSRRPAERPIANGMGIDIRTCAGMMALLLAASGAAWAEDLRTEGTQRFEERMERLGETAREHAQVEQRIHDECLARTVITQSGSVTGVLAGSCQSLRDESARLATEVRSGIVQAKDDARRAGVYPGKVRDGIRREHLEDFSD
jgi:hypothetical protein